MSKEAVVEAYSYVNIFETKGIEYLLVIAFLIAFLLFVRAMRSHPSLAAGNRTESTVRPMPICFSNRTCPHKRAFEGNLSFATPSNVRLDEGCVPHLCTCPDLEFVESPARQKAV